MVMGVGEAEGGAGLCHWYIEGRKKREQRAAGAAIGSWSRVLGGGGNRTKKEEPKCEP